MNRRQVLTYGAFGLGASALAPGLTWARLHAVPRRVEWDRIVPELQRCRIAKAVHQGALEKICELYAAGVVLYKQRDFTGSRMQAAEYRKALNEFGLTAASAGRVGGTGDHGDTDPADEFFPGPRLAS